MKKIFNINNSKIENNTLNKKNEILKSIDKTSTLEKYYIFKTWDENNNKPVFNESKLKLNINKAWNNWSNCQELEGESINNDCIFIKKMAIPLCALVTKYALKAYTPISKEILILDKMHEIEYYSTLYWDITTVRSIFYKTWLTYLPELDSKDFADILIHFMDKMFKEFRKIKKI